jgi:hypothetical protein
LVCRSGEELGRRYAEYPREVGNESHGYFGVIGPILEIRHGDRTYAELACDTTH